jgi:hypothetical protein
MVAGNRTPGHRQPVELGTTVTQIRSVARPVQAQIAEVDNQVKSADIDITEHSVPVGLRLRRRRRQMGV